MPTCPNGHQSGNDDWCDECGLRVSPSAAASPVSFNRAFPNTAPGAAGDPTAMVEICPTCGTPREGQEAFCEECRFNFAARPGAPVPSAPASPAFPAAGPAFPPSSERTTSASSRMRRPAEPLTTDVAFAADGGDFLLSPPTHHRAPSTEQSQLPPPARRPAQDPGTWTVLVAADREYFTAMMSRSGPDASGLFFPTYSPELRVPLTGERTTIGRRRHTTGEAPDIDLSRPPEDPGVSHRHAVLSRRPDGGWSVTDQNSTNGTTVNGAADPIEPHRPVDLADGDRVHVGAWTTITLRRD